MQAGDESYKSRATQVSDKDLVAGNANEKDNTRNLLYRRLVSGYLDHLTDLPGRMRDVMLETARSTRSPMTKREWAVLSAVLVLAFSPRFFVCPGLWAGNGRVQQFRVRQQLAPLICGQPNLCWSLISRTPRALPHDVCLVFGKIAVAAHPVWTPTGRAALGQPPRLCGGDRRSIYSLPSLRLVDHLGAFVFSLCHTTYAVGARLHQSERTPHLWSISSLLSRPAWRGGSVGLAAEPPDDGRYQ